MKVLENMNVVHINVESPFMDNSGYQETLLANSHKKLCNNVTIINSNRVLHDDGSETLCEAGEYYNDYGVKIIRMGVYDNKNKRHIDVGGLYNILEKEMPDFIMIHGVLSFDVLAVAKYVKKKNDNCIVIADSHATRDNANIMLNSPKNILFRTMIKLFNRYMSKYYQKVYGVVDDAVDVMVKYAGIPREKTEVLGLGYDDDLIDFENQISIKTYVREKYGVPQDVILLVHGGKLNEGKQTHKLVSIMQNMEKNVHLVIFGGFDSETYKARVLNLTKGIEERIHVVGVLNQKEIYELYLSADGAVFPGTASCLRQQAVAAGLPIVIGYNEADTGINILINGNAIYLREGWSQEELLEAIKEICYEPEYKKRAVALGKGEYRKYSYTNQAKEMILSNLS